MVNAVAILIVLYLVLGPLVTLVITSLEDTSRGVRIKPPFPWTGANFRLIYASSTLYEDIGTTLLFALGTLAFAFVVAGVFAWLIERTDMPCRSLAFVLVIAPIGIPTVVLAIAWSLLLNPTNGVLNTLLRHVPGLGGGDGPVNIYSLFGMIFVNGMALVPLTFLLITPALRSMSASLEEAARTSGANSWLVFRKVVLPLWRPALIGAAIYEFVSVIEATDIPLIIGLPGRVHVLTTDLYLESFPKLGLPNYGAAGAEGLALIAMALVTLLFYNRVVGSSSAYVTISGKGFRTRVRRLGKWKPLALLFVFGYAAVSLVLPMLMVIWSSLRPYIGGLSVAQLKQSTISGYKQILTGADGGASRHAIFIQSLENTLKVATVSAAAVVVLSVPLSWIVIRSRSRFRWLADFLAFVGHGIPASVLGLGVLLVYLVLPLPIYGTVWIVVIAYATKYISLATRATNAGMAQIQRSLEEAAAASGGNVLQVWWHVVLPLLRPVLISTFLLIFLESVRMLTLPLFLSSAQGPLLSTFIYSQWVSGETEDVGVLSVVTTAITVIVTILLMRLGRYGRSAVPQDRSDRGVPAAPSTVQPVVEVA